jgi:anthranilate 1,2-dioxygenase small subunit
MDDGDLRLQHEIEQLLGRYAHCLDDDRLEEWPKFFAATCLYKITSAENLRRGLPVGLFFANTRGMLEDRVSALREANIYEPQRYRHFIAQTVILEHDAAIARVQSSFQIVRIMQDGRTMLFATGTYLDRIAIAAAPFLFEERIVVCDSDRIDTLLALPF